MISTSASSKPRGLSGDGCRLRVVFGAIEPLIISLFPLEGLESRTRGACIYQVAVVVLPRTQEGHVSRLDTKEITLIVRVKIAGVTFMIDRYL